MRIQNTCRFLALILALIAAHPSSAAEKSCGVYTSIVSFASRKAIADAVAANPPFLMDKHKRAFGGADNSQAVAQVRDARFNTLWMTIYPLWGKDWWNIPAARNLVTDAVAQSRGQLKVHLGLSLFNANVTADPSRYPGALRTIQCDGTRPQSVCFLDDGFWDYLIKNATEMAKVANEFPDTVDGIFLDPEAYGPECYLCFCDNCVRKFNTFSGEKMPTALVKPDGWLLARPGMWKRFTVDWHDQEVRRHASAMREAIHALNPKLQLSSLLWDYPVAVGIGDARQGYFRQLAIGLGTKAMPAWTLPEHSYYSDGPDLDRIITQIETDIRNMNAAGLVKILPGIRILRQPASTLIERGKVIHERDVPGYWMYEWSDLKGKAPIDFEGAPIESEQKYIEAFQEMNRLVRSPPAATHK